MRISDWSSDVCSSDLWLSCPAVQHINVALLAGEDERRNRSTGRREVDERSLRTEIIIPYVLFHRLEPPDRFTCRHIQRNKRGCIEVFGWTPQTAVIVSSGIAHRQRSEESRVGKEGVIRVDLGGRRHFKKKNSKTIAHKN